VQFNLPSQLPVMLCSQKFLLGITGKLSSMTGECHDHRDKRPPTGMVLAGPVSGPGMNSVPLADRDWRVVEATYLSRNDQPHCVIDDFLTSQAAEELRERLLNHHGWHFKHPLSKELYLAAPGGDDILDLGKNLVDQLPQVLGGLELVYHWAYLHCRSAGLKPHTDGDSAVTVNLYLTPDEFNLRPGTGGLILSAVRRPPSVSLIEFNSMPWADSYFEREHAGGDVRDVRIAYHYNRAILFDSGLFHASDQTFFPNDTAHTMKMNLGLVFDDPVTSERRRAAFLDRLSRAEALAAERGIELSSLSYETADGLWHDVGP
jgi:hypothetical protein